METPDADRLDERSVALRRALGDRRRAALVRELESATDGRDIDHLADAVGLHPNTVRWHLGVLVDAGLVVAHPSASHRPGRPRILYRLRPQVAGALTDEHRLLATILTDVIAALDGASERAEAAARSWGRHVAAADRGTCDADHTISTLVDLLDVQGFAPEARGSSIDMRRCPLHDLAEAHPEVVCAIHRGLVAGALEELGAPFEVSRLRPFVEPDLCVLELAPRVA